MDNLSCIILVAQTALLTLQLILAYKVYMVGHSQISGYFTLVSNLKVAKEIARRFHNYYDLTDALKFRVSGDSVLFACWSSLSINGVTRIFDNIPSGASFDPDGSFSIMRVPLDLSSCELEGDTIDIVFAVKLKNKSGYFYLQRLVMSFEKDKTSNSKWWRLSSYNCEFKRIFKLIEGWKHIYNKLLIYKCRRCVKAK